MQRCSILATKHHFFVALENTEPHLIRAAGLLLMPGQFITAQGTEVRLGPFWVMLVTETNLCYNRWIHISRYLESLLKSTIFRD